MGRYANEAQWQWQIDKYSLQLLKSSALISASPLNINKRLSRYTRTILWTRKNETLNFVVILKTLPFDRNKT